MIYDIYAYDLGVLFHLLRQDVWGNVPSFGDMISFTNDLQMPLMDTSNCHPLNGRNATDAGMGTRSDDS